MIDLKAFREDPKPYQDSAHRRGLKIDFDRILKLDEQYRQMQRQIESNRAALKLESKPQASQREKLKQVKQELEQQEKKQQAIEGELDELLPLLPNLIAPDTPDGAEEANREERQWGKAEKREVKDHLGWLEARQLVDFERGAKVAGSKFYFYKGAAVKLELAIKQLALAIAEEAGFIPMDVPHLVNGRIAAGTGFAPQGPEQQIYSIEGEDLHLIATAEIPLTGYHADEILDPSSLPRLYAGWSPSYRKEAGAYGAYSRGLYRVHQFNKLELYVFCSPEESGEWLERLVKLEEEVCRALEIPYRVVRIATGELSAPAYQKYDVEYWSPAEGQYRELMSASNCTDFQARRLNIRTRDREGNTIPVHTLNATAAAISRVLIALVENHQAADGSLKLPAALAKYYGGKTID